MNENNYHFNNEAYEMKAATPSCGEQENACINYRFPTSCHCEPCNF